MFYNLIPGILYQPVTINHIRRNIQIIPTGVYCITNSIFIIACIEDAKGLNKERDISSAEYRIKSALIHYIVQNQYNLNICKYIMSRNWFYDDQTAILGLGVEI